MNRPTCETCPFWAVIVTDAVGGECHCNPPPWRSTQSTDFCGSHPQFADFKFQWRQAEVAKQGEQAKAKRCEKIMLNHAYCVLPVGHAGPHEARGLFMDEPDRCQWVVGNEHGERCGKKGGHDGKHVWESGD